MCRRRASPLKKYSSFRGNTVAIEAGAGQRDARCVSMYFAPLTLLIYLAPLWLAPLMGLMGGIDYSAFIDLAMRSCPPGLQGTLMMATAGAYELAWRGGDLLGAWIYARNPLHGFLYCALATTAVYALILPVLLLIPREIIATADGERNAVAEAEMLAEVGEAVA